MTGIKVTYLKMAGMKIPVNAVPTCCGQVMKPKGWKNPRGLGSKVTDTWYCLNCGNTTEDIKHSEI